MKIVVSNPNYSDAQNSDNWQVPNNVDAAVVLSDLTKLSVGSVLNDATHYKAAHVEDISRMLTGYSQLVVKSYGESNYAAVAGDPFVYVDSTAGFGSGQTAVLLEGLKVGYPPYSTDATSTDSFTTEWIDYVANTGLIPAASLADYVDEGGFPVAVVGSLLYPSGSTIASTLDPQIAFGATYAPTPAAVGSSTPPYFYISASGDENANYNLTEYLLNDFTTTPANITTVTVGSTSTSIVIAGFLDEFKAGQTVTIALESTNMGWYAGIVTGTTQVTSSTASCTLAAGSYTATGSTSGLVLGAGITGSTAFADGTVVQVIGTGQFTLSQAALLDGTASYATVNTTITTDLTTSSTHPFPFPASATGTYTFSASIGATFTKTIQYDVHPGDNYITGQNGGEAGLTVGQLITMPGVIPSGTTITNINGTSIYLSNAATGSATAPATFTVTALPTQAVVSSTDGLAVGQSVAGNGVSLYTIITSISGDIGDVAPIGKFLISLSQITLGLTLPATETLTSYDLQAFGATLTNEEIRLNYGSTSLDCTYLTTPYYVTGTGANAQRYGQNLIVPAQAAKTQSKPLATIQNIVGATASYTITVDDVTPFAGIPPITFLDQTVSSYSVNTTDSSITISGSTPSSIDFSGSYSNGDTKASIYKWDDTVGTGAAFDTIPASTGAGVVGFTAPVTGFHDVNTLIGCYPATGYYYYIGSNTVGDQERVVLSTIGSRVGTTLAGDIQAQVSAGMLVNPNPSTGSTDFNEATNQYGMLDFYGGWTPLIDPNAADADRVFTVVVGQGETQEMVRVVWNPVNVESSVYHTTTTDGTPLTPAIWSLDTGQSFQYDHLAGEPVCTPNLTFASLSTVGHAKDTPVLGSPDIAPVYDPATGITNYDAAAALIAYNPSGTLVANPETELGFGQPWTPSGDNGSPNISTTLASDAAQGDNILTLAGDTDFPDQYPAVYPAGIAFLPPEVGRVVGEVTPGSTQVPFIATGDLLSIKPPFFVQINGTVYEVINVSTSA